MKNSNRRNLLFVLDKPVKLYIVGKDIPSGLSWWIIIWAVTPNKDIKAMCLSYSMERNCQFPQWNRYSCICWRWSHLPCISCQEHWINLCPAYESSKPNLCNLQIGMVPFEKYCKDQTIFRQIQRNAFIHAFITSKLDINNTLLYGTLLNRLQIIQTACLPKLQKQWSYHSYLEADPLGSSLFSSASPTKFCS